MMADILVLAFPEGLTLFSLTLIRHALVISVCLFSKLSDLVLLAGQPQRVRT